MSIKSELSYLGQNKIFAHADRIADWQRTDKTLPITVEIDATNNCNHNCPGCAGGRKDREHLSFDFLVNIIDQLSSFCRGIIFTGGGEPLCNKGTVNAVSYAKSKGIDIGFITNGGLLDEKNSEILVRNCTWIRVSIDAGCGSDYEKSHGVNSAEFDKVWNNVSQLSAIKKKYNSDVTLGVAYLTNSEFISGMLPFVLMAKNSGVDYAQFRPYHFDSTNVLDEIEKLRYVETQSFKIISSAHKYQLMRDNNWLRGYQKCFGHHFATVISANGKMYLCCHMRGNEKYCLGNLNYQSFFDIWKSEKRKKVFSSINFQDCPPMCRCDTFNEILWNIYLLKIQGVHLNFL